MINNITLPMGAIVAFCRKHHIHKMSLFGSVLRDDFRPDSDIDVLVEFEAGARVGFFEFSAMQDELGELLGREVDLHTPTSLSRHFRYKVLRQAETIYERTG